MSQDLLLADAMLGYTHSDFINSKGDIITKSLSPQNWARLCAVELHPILHRGC